MNSNIIREYLLVYVIVQDINSLYNVLKTVPFARPNKQSFLISKLICNMYKKIYF